MVKAIFQNSKIYFPFIHSKGGQFILNLVDFFGASYIVFILAIAELVAVCWIYGTLINSTSTQKNIFLLSFFFFSLEMKIISCL